MTVLSVLCALVVMQEPAEEPAPPSTEPPAEHVESPRAKRLREAVEASRNDEHEPPKPPPPKPKEKESQFAKAISSGPLHYAFYYAPDYASVVGMGALELGFLLAPPPPATHAAFGPSYDPAKRDSSEVYDHQYDRLLGAQHRPDTVPEWLSPVAGNAVVLALGGLTFVRDRTFRKLHHFILGAAQAQLSTSVLTEMLKNTFGRLRPDYRDRMARYYCKGDRGEIPSGVDCSEVNQEIEAGRNPSSVYLTQKEFDDGRRSFPSGHSSNAFAVATYLALFLGGEYVWGESATSVSRIPAVGAQAALLTAAAFVAASRITDNRHHPEDVVVGGGLGAAMSACFYFLHFDLQGRPLVRSVSFSPAVGSGIGFNLNGLLP